MLLRVRDLAGAHFSFLREQASAFESVTAIANYSETSRDLARAGRAQRLRVLEVTSDYFHTLRSGPLRDRDSIARTRPTAGVRC